MWLLGPANSGKSMIAQAIAEHWDAEKILLATFFFSQHDLSRNHVLPLFMTIAYQVAMNFPDSWNAITRVVEQNPSVLKQCPEFQLTSRFSSLPLSSSLFNKFTKLLDGILDHQTHILLSLMVLINAPIQMCKLTSSAPFWRHWKDANFHWNSSSLVTQSHILSQSSTWRPLNPSSAAFPLMSSIPVTTCSFSTYLSTCKVVEYLPRIWGKIPEGKGELHCDFWCCSYHLT